MKILLTGGGSGGHAVPVVAVWQALQQQLRTQPEYLWVGSKKGIERKLATEIGMQYKAVCTGKLRRYFSWQNIIDIFKIPIGVIQSLWVVGQFKPDVVFSKGGYVSVPVAIAAWLWRVPIITHESDITPGLANRIVAQVAKKVAVSFSRTAKSFPKHKTTLTGNPLRRETLLGDAQEAKKYFGLTSEKPIIFVIGGSQGAKKMNNILLSALPELLAKYQILHVSGQDNYEEVKAKAGEVNEADGYSLRPFLAADEMGLALSMSDLAVTRAGINTLNELAAHSIPAIIIPIDQSVLGEHQEVNARYFKEAGAAASIFDNQLTAGLLTEKINDTIKDFGKYQEMKRKMAKLANREASDKVADHIIALAQKNEN